MDEGAILTNLSLATGGRIRSGRAGFTLIEMSIVLTFVGLVAGGVLVGRDLIAASKTSATIAQIQSYKGAVATFQYRFDALPGDMNAKVAKAYGFTPRGTSPGEGDGNGVLEGYSGANGCNGGMFQGLGETTMFWVDLTSADGLNLKLIDGSFNTASPNNVNWSLGAVTPDVFYPAAKLGGGNYIYVWSGGTSLSNSNSGCPVTGNNGTNYFGLADISTVNILGTGAGFEYYGYLSTTPGITVKQAYDIDRKIDDGLPTTGGVIAIYLASGGPYWSILPWGGYSATVNNPTTQAIPASSTTCFDNGNRASALPTYSLAQNHGAGLNCALSFQF